MQISYLPIIATASERMPTAETETAVFLFLWKASENVRRHW